MLTSARSPQLQVVVRNPGDGRVVGTVADTTAEQVSRVIDGLRSHQPAWDALGPRGRASWLLQLRDWLLDNASQIIGVLQDETGKPRAEAAIEVPVICDLLNYHARHASAFLADEHPHPHGPLTANKRLTRTLRPYAVVGVIAPWNFPLAMPAMDAIPALTAGAAVIVKPSEVTPLSALEMARGWSEIGAPPVFACVTGTGPTGVAVVDNVDFIQFTGSTSTGRRVAVRAAERLIPCSLELGGKDAAIVLADAPLERAVNGVAWGALMNAGQVCVSTERVYVEAAIHDRFVSRLVERVAELRQGLDADEFSVDVGPLATEAQVGIVEEHISDAVRNGATVLCGGRRTGTGNFVEPTVLVDVDHSMACMQQETFGPIIPVMKVPDVDEAVALTNDSPYGLSATVWTSDRGKGELVARRLAVGAVNINDTLVNLFCQPLAHSGWKSSGLGSRFGGAAGVRKYCRQQVLTSPRLLTLASEPIWFPYTARRSQLVGRLLRLLVAGDPRRRLGVTCHSAPHDNERKSDVQGR